MKRTVSQHETHGVATWYTRCPIMDAKPVTLLRVGLKHVLSRNNVLKLRNRLFLMKTYLKFVQSGYPLNVICSPNSNFKLLHLKEDKNLSKIYVACAALENVIVWNLSNASIKMVLEGEKSFVTRIEVGPVKMAAGYEDGHIKLWDMESWAHITLDGHTSAVTCLDFDKDSTKLVSGSLDTYMIIWDVLNECGLYKLKGHTNAVTNCKFMTLYPILISSSKDKSIKMWDLTTQHCFATLQDPDFEVLDFLLCKEEQMMISADSGEDLKIWSLVDNVESSGTKRHMGTGNTLLDIPMKCNMVSRIFKKHSVSSKLLRFDHQYGVLYCLNNDSTLEAFKLKKSSSLKVSNQTTIFEENNMSDCFESLCEIPATNVCHLELLKNRKYQNMICIAHKKNCITLNTVNLEDPSLKFQNILSISNSGHRSSPTCVAINSNSTFFATGSNEIKIWSIKDRCCIQTISTEQCKSLIYVTGDRYLIGGMKSGALYIYDMLNAQVVECLNAHGGAIVHLKEMPNKNGFASCSVDQVSHNNVFTIKNVRQLEMEDPVTSFCYSNCQTYIAVSALNDVKLFYDDTLKYCLTLYGHKLPVNCIDISSDNEIIVTGSADNSVKIWGLTFGDCRKSIHAHSSSINCLKFVPETHYFFSCSSDSSIKYWDGDTFQNILELKRHGKSVPSFALNSDGDLLISISKDCSIRIWEKIEELMVPDAEENEEGANNPMITLAKDQDKEAQAHWKPSLSSVQHTENLVDALDIAMKAKNSDEPTHPVLISWNMSANQYVLYVLTSIPSNQLDVTLLILPYKYVLIMLSLFTDWFDRPNQFEMCLRCCLFLMKLHFYQLINTPQMEPLINKLRQHSKKSIQKLKEVDGTNKAVLDFIKNLQDTKPGGEYLKF
ncbi:WD repeat-containing protein 3 [Thelohanellus kitauei]|uniref:WD repeat-containing protein 3 n=1 Tax=Thelohanellus kitauei TaxID=669202 RepID=A0A0C2MSM3_THEKT|nr:WD repeat-containing protein 3 [Thelohanellus kitauei]